MPKIKPELTEEELAAKKARISEARRAAGQAAARSRWGKTSVGETVSIRCPVATAKQLHALAKKEKKLMSLLLADIVSEYVADKNGQ